jgi:hypothetical protein
MSLVTFEFTGNGDFIFVDLDWAIFGTGTQIGRGNVVLASITEIDQDGEPFVGAATVAVHNIAPRDDNHIHMIVAVLWDSPLNCRVYMAVFD